MLLYRIINIAQDFSCIQEGIDNIGRWIAENDLHLNSTKCKVMFVTRQRSKVTAFPVLQLYGRALERVFEYKYLGIVLTCNLSWTPHVERIVHGQDTEAGWNALPSISTNQELQ